MAEVAIQNRPRPRRKGRLARGLLAAAVVIAVLFAGWLVAGNLRTNGLAREYFLAHHGDSTVSNVTIDAESPWMPPFWSVRISGDVTEPGSAPVAYRSYMWLLIEPITGSVVLNGAG
jgi:hypothetical protein